MRIVVINTATGLIPAGDYSYDEKRRLKIGEMYECDIKVARNIKFHKKAFALLNATWSLMDENKQASWRSRDGFRAYLTVAAGYYDVYYNPRLQEFVESPRSWSFDKMDEATFNGLYDRMKDVIFRVLGDRITEEIFESVLANF